ncbi:MAG: efflux RND transporter periplasmic adaptor subunit [Pseudomonadota bacterium]|nr:MAG: efflux RND transporter periplasmic adaptor subunit [Pseudomonadota bacterium]
MPARPSLWTLIALVSAFASTAAAVELPFAVAPVSLQVMAQERTFDGLTEAVQQSTVSAQVTGRITEINFDVDDFVTKGDTILRFRDKSQRAAVDAAQARFEEASAEFDRVADLHERKLVARAAFDKAQAGLKAAKAELERAQEQLEHTVVRAPYAGIVTERHVELGETANVGQPLVTGLSLEEVRVTVNLPQDMVGVVRERGQARVVLPHLGGREVAAEKITVFPYADPVSHAFTARVELPAGLQGVYPGMFAKVSFVTEEVQRLVVPASAVVHRSEVTAVYVVGADGEVGFRQVRLGNVAGDNVIVLAGLSEGDRVALDPTAAAVYLQQQASGTSS